MKERLAGETTSYGALQYLQSFVARKKKAVGVDAISQVIFYGCALLIERGDAEDAGNALVWYIGNDDLLHLSNNTKGEGQYCDTERVLALFQKFTSAQLVACASVLYDPLHQIILDSRLTTGTNTDSAISQRMRAFDEICANVFEQTSVWRSAYRVCVRLNHIARAASILDRWSSTPGCYKHEKPLFFARAILTLLAEKKIERAVEMTNASKTIMAGLDNVTSDPVRPSGDDSATLACWHLSIIFAELAALPAAPRVDKVKLFSVLVTIYGGLIEKLDRKLVELVDKIGSDVFLVGGVKEKPGAMNFLQAMLQSSGMGGAGAGKAGSGGGGKGPLGGMNPSELLALLNQYQGGGK